MAQPIIGGIALQQVNVNYSPGPTEVPLGGLVSNGRGISLIAWGGRSRLEAAATTIFAAMLQNRWPQMTDDDYPGVAKLAVDAAEILLQEINQHRGEPNVEAVDAREGDADKAAA